MQAEIQSFSGLPHYKMVAAKNGLSETPAIFFYTSNKFVLK